LWDSTASTKEDMVGILVESPKITKEKISAMLKPVEEIEEIGDRDVVEK
jgi:hypothetical protein